MLYSVKHCALLAVTVGKAAAAAAAKRRATLIYAWENVALFFLHSSARLKRLTRTSTVCVCIIIWESEHIVNNKYGFKKRFTVD